MALPIQFSKERLAEICRRYHIRNLAFFGSVLREDFHAESDVDILYEFEEGKEPGWGIVDLEEELSNLLGGRKVDLVAKKYLNLRLRDQILSTAETAYAA